MICVLDVIPISAMSSSDDVFPAYDGTTADMATKI